jgi:outer membrane protein insertion porin family
VTRQPEGERVHLHFDVDAGEQLRVAAVEIRGNRLTRNAIVRRELELAPGDLLSREKMLASQRNLYRLGVFRDVRLTHRPLPGAADETARLVEIEVDEAPPLATSVGIGADTEGGLRGRFSLTHENVAGTDRVIGIQGRASGIERRLQLTAKDPRLFTRRLPALFNVSWETRDEVGFDRRTTGAALRVDRSLGPRWSGFVRYGYQRVDLENVQNGLAVIEEKLEDIALGDLGVTFYRDTRDDPFATERGSLLTLSGRLFAAPLGSAAELYKTNVGWLRVFPLGSRTSFLTAARAGMSLPIGETDRVPLPERFFLGGSSTLRGFDRDRVGPKSPEGLPLGGEGHLVLNQELRFPLRGPLGGSLFYDTGNVWEDATDLEPFELRHVLGAGLRYETPIGPVRIEYGRKLDREPGESSGELSISIGPLF